MPAAAQLEDLAAKHKALDRLIAEEMARPSSDDLKLAELKREKLRLKDEISKLQGDHTH